MSHASMATPCPSQTARPLGTRLSIAAFDDFPDDTVDIEYTRAIQHEFRNAKPKRRPSAMSRRIERNAPITIFEDVLEDRELMLDGSEKKLEGKTLLGKPAQRLPTSTLAARKPVEVETKPQARAAAAQPRRRPSIMSNEVLQAVSQPEKSSVSKDMRRRTIFVPADETTLMTIHPGAKNTIRFDDTFLFPKAEASEVEQGEEASLSDLPSFQRPMRRPRKSLAAAPRRLPLQHMESNQNDPSFDVAGANTGKENLPPCAGVVAEKNAVMAKERLANGRASLAASKLHEPTAASHSRQPILARKAVQFPPAKSIVPQKRASLCKATAPSAVPTQKARLGATHISRPGLNVSRRATPPESLPETRIQKQQELRAMIESKRHEIRALQLAQYPTLAEDLSHPELYEDGWLQHQEVALTEVVNQIFQESEQKSCRWRAGQGALRERMIETYHQPEVIMLYKRIQASLVYGALSPPKDTAPQSINQDIGLRKRFLNLWLDNYTEEALCTAAEVVVGRKVPRHSSVSVGDVSASESLLDPHASRRSLTGFLEMFFVSVGDLDPAEGRRSEIGTSVDTARWRKTMLRSIMLIWLLDHAKASEDISVCLFQLSAGKKSSIAVLNGLCSMLLPSTGDVSRALRHLEYELAHLQDPLDEVSYHVSNLAVDLRDGTFLAHLVEILLYSSSSITPTHNDENATVTIAMPDATVLESALFLPDRLGPAPRILSQHLKMPCIGRAQKVHNVQIALSALESHNVHGANVVGDIVANDIVDGHREKTLSLLWSLVASFGLSVLVDWQELVADIQRNCGRVASDVNLASRDGQESLLQAWASVRCSSAGQDVNVANLTSSFASGKVYALLITTFAAFIPTSRDSSSKPGNSERAILENRLRAIGCSNAFIKQLTVTVGVVPSRETTISNLAFLASRLLPLARNHFAAVRIQRAFRHKSSKKAISRRVTLMRLAHACATVVQTRTRIIHAAEVLQRAWKRVLAVRIERLNRDVVYFQALAKGWQAKKKSILKNDRPAQFVTAGW